MAKKYHIPANRRVILNEVMTRDQLVKMTVRDLKARKELKKLKEERSISEICCTISEEEELIKWR